MHEDGGGRAGHTAHRRAAANARLDRKGAVDHEADLNPTFHRYVAIGDSSTEGLDDPDGQGGYRGWADRLAEHVARSQAEPLLYANLAIRGRKTQQIREEQLAPALAMKPDLASCFSGTNDVLRRDFDVEAVRADLGAMWGALRGAGATVVSLTVPDLSGVIWFADRMLPRVVALNAAMHDLAQEHGVILLDLSRHPMVRDPRMWSGDRLHANALGHGRIAAALAQALGLPGFDASWERPLPARPPVPFVMRAAEEVAWAGAYLLPWIGRRLTGRSSGDGVTAKRPQLAPVELGP